jgi:hypothetical protein
VSSSRAHRTLALAGLCAWMAGCSLRAPRVTENTCNRDRDCGSGRVCFANECRSPASALGAVMVEVTAPTSSPYAPLQQSLDLKTSAVATLSLSQPKRYEGTLLQDADANGAPAGVASAALEFHDAHPIIPGRAFSVSVQTDPSGAFAARLPPSVQTLRITPPPPLPTFTSAVPDGDSKGVVLHLPPPSQLASVSGTLKLSGLPLPFARVVPVDGAGQLEGAATVSDASGHFNLVLPPAPVQYFLRIGDTPDAATQAPARGPLPAFADDAFGLRTALAGAANTLDVEVGPLPLPATLAGRVVDATSAPIAQARVTAASEGATGWVLTSSTLSAADGSFSLPLREGRYLVEALPSDDPAQPALSGVLEVTVSATATQPLVILCPPKVLAAGRVLRSGGTSLSAGAQVIATRLPDGLIGGRTASATATDKNGSFTLVGDPGLYRVEIIPTTESGEPRGLALIELSSLAAALGNVQLDAIQLSPPLVVAGAVLGAGTTTPVAGAAVDVFAVNGAGDAAVRIGSTVTDATGKYRLVLPDVSQPAAALAPSR